MNFYDCESYKCCKSFLEEKIIDICQNHYAPFLSLPNVVGVGLGNKYVCKINTNNKCISVFVTKKIPENKLLIERRIPKSYRGIITDVIQTGEFNTSQLSCTQTQPVYANRIRPAMGGYSIGCAASKVVGTMTCLVKDKKDNYILSCSHVLNPNNEILIGTPILQPGLDDGGEYPKDAVAYLKDFVPIKFITEQSKPENYVDAAIALVPDISLVSNKVVTLGRLPSIYPYIFLEDIVTKVGRTTGSTNGKVKFLGVTLTIRNFDKYALFKNQIITSNYSEPGDSGSILIKYFIGSPIGMMMGSNNKQLSVFNMISSVVDALGVYIA